MALDFLSLASSLCRCRASLAARAPPSLALLLSYSSWLVLLLAKNPMYVAYVSCHFLIYTISMDVTKLDPAALRHGTRLRCGGGKHQSKVSEIYYRHKTVFMDGPTSRSVPCNWPPPGLHRATLHCLTLTSARSNGTKELVERDAVDPHPKLNLPDTAQQKLAERGAAGLNLQPQTQTQALACNRPQRDIQNHTTAHLQQITQRNIPRGSVTE